MVAGKQNELLGANVDPEWVMNFAPHQMQTENKQPASLMTWPAFWTASTLCAMAGARMVTWSLDWLARIIVFVVPVILAFKLMGWLMRLDFESRVVGVVACWSLARGGRAHGHWCRSACLWSPLRFWSK